MLEHTPRLRQHRKDAAENHESNEAAVSLLMAREDDSLLGRNPAKAKKLSSKRIRNRTVFVVIVLILVVSIVVLETYFPCILSETEQEKLVYMITAFDEVMTELNIVHWLDCGSLLGAMRYGNVIPWDYDGDVSFVRSEADKLHDGGIAQKIMKERYGIHLNAAIMLYKGAQVDIASWNKVPNPDVPGQFIYTKAVHRHLEWWEKAYNDFNSSHVEDTIRTSFGGYMVSIPNRPWQYLYRRYKHSLTKGAVPFKISCWMPWHWSECRRLTNMAQTKPPEEPWE